MSLDAWGSVWYASQMPTELPKDALKAAQAAVEFAESTRKFHARRTDKGARQREDDLKTALERLKGAMRPLRQEIARFPYGPQTVTAEENRNEIRRASKAIQTERRKLWKMQKR